MQSLGLGGIELEHAVEKHRPDGYRVPDILSRVSIDDYYQSGSDDQGIFGIFSAYYVNYTSHIKTAVGLFSLGDSCKNLLTHFYLIFRSPNNSKR